MSIVDMAVMAGSASIAKDLCALGMHSVLENVASDFVRFFSFTAAASMRLNTFLILPIWQTKKIPEGTPKSRNLGLEAPRPGVGEFILTS